MTNERCIAHTWPQSRANVACFTPAGQLKWIRYWDPASQLKPASPDSVLYVAYCVTESTLAAVYRERATNKWFISSIRNRDGATSLHHVDLGITDAFLSGTFTPHRNDVLIASVSAGMERVYKIDNTGTATTAESDPHTLTNVQRWFLPNGQLVSIGRSGLNWTLIVTDSFGEVWRATNFATASTAVTCFTREDSTSSGVAYFLVDSGASGEWEWWKIDSAANTVGRTAAGKSFTPPPNNAAFGEVAKASANKIWIINQFTTGSHVVELRDIVDDTSDVLLQIVASDFDGGGHAFDQLQVTATKYTRSQRPGYNIDASGRFFLGALDQNSPGAVRFMSCSESNTRLLSPVLEFTQRTIPAPVVIADGMAAGKVLDVNEQESPTPGENGQVVDVGEWAVAWTAGESSLDPAWAWRAQSGTGMSMHPMSWLTDEGDVIYFLELTALNIAAPTFATRYQRNGTRILDVTRSV